jgi:hypothetical protein
MDSKFEQELRESLYIHIPLKPDMERSLETYDLQKEVLDEIVLWDGKDLKPWTFDGEGRVRIEDGKLICRTGSRNNHWPGFEARSVNAPTGKYATFGSFEPKLCVRGMDLAKYNRLYFKIRPTCKGMHNPTVRAAFISNGEVKIPDTYSREGWNAINLVNHEWNTCTWEIDSIAHDKIEEVSFIIHRYGKEVSSGDDLDYEITDIRLQRVEANIVHGWQCKEETAAYSTTGYDVEGTKTAVANTTAKEFAIVDAKTGEKVFTGAVENVKAYHGEFQVLDFTDLTREGSYKLRMGSFESKPFVIAKDVFVSTVWKLLNFLFGERCGCPVPGKHGTCHQDVVGHHRDVSMVFAGGWHDAADVSQEAVQTCETAHAFLCVARALQDENPILAARLLEEAEWGVDLVLRTRFGDGYRITGAGMRRWTDNMIGNFDDVEARVSNNSFVNFTMAACEADMSQGFEKFDKALAWKCLDAAKEDYDFAYDRFSKIGLETYQMMEHAHGSALSQYYASALWGAALLYKYTKEEKYIDRIHEFANGLLLCQETGEGGLPMKGFFYRDEVHSQIMHSSHQCREHLYAMALVGACEALPDDPRKAAWEKSLRLYAGYLKELMKYDAPYGMIPAGIYEMREIYDKEAFRRVHEDRVVYEDELDNYAEQLKNAIPLGKDCYLKAFPVWFSFRGNSGVLLSMGKSATIMGKYFNDAKLLQIGREQLYWTLGKNPFGQSLIYGEGDRYGQMYTALLGETVGELTVGVETKANLDEPYWPPANIATYREVWTTPPTRWLWIAADLM